MKAVVFHNVGDIRLEEVANPKIQNSQDAIVRLTASAICGTDLHMVRGTMPGMKSGTILGHEGVGIIEEIGRNVRNFKPGDRVVIASTIACGYCVYCRAGYFSQCDHANPNGKDEGTAFFGGPAASGPFHGMQAEKVRVPFAHVGLVKIPDNVTDDQAITVSDIFPTGYFGAELADIHDGKIVSVFGCGPVGLFTIISAKLMGAGRIIAIDHLPDRLEKAQELGAESINFDKENPVDTILDITGGIGTDCAVDAVGVDAEPPESKWQQWKNKVSGKEEQQKEQIKKAVPKQNPDGELWNPGGAPTQAIEWAVDSVAKAGTISITGVYTKKIQNFPLGKAMRKNLTLRMGNCNHRKYIPMLLDLISAGIVDPLKVLSHQEPLSDAIEAFKAFDRRDLGWIKVVLDPTNSKENKK
ncbi:MAG: glutathione-dependent formaldehyde dehydrogenase [Alphaproteobacteria bacterium]|nr:glutathione-dependent formaldehyde dehydrogenase [Alphaproteobacteria bacterium]